VEDPRLRKIVRRQRGLFHRDQAKECGYSARQVRARVLSGQWCPVFGGVLTTGDRRITPTLKDRAAQLAIPGSVLAGPSAAPFHGLTVARTRPFLIVDRRVRCRDDVRLVVEQLGRPDVLLLDGALVTSAERTVLDCVMELGEANATDLLDRALQRGIISLEQLIRAAHTRVGRPGAPKLARLVSIMATGTRSACERRLTMLLRLSGIRGWVGNVEIWDDAGLIGIGDVVFTDDRLVIEADGFAFHTTPERFQLDRVRQNRLIAAGWIVLRFTWRDLTQRPAYVVATVRLVLEDRRR
jgi:hypothetical protein